MQNRGCIPSPSAPVHNPIYAGTALVIGDLHFAHTTSPSETPQLVLPCG
jgi:hypothetical protein